jgi:hypothetical protein
MAVKTVCMDDGCEKKGERICNNPGLKEAAML